MKSQAEKLKSEQCRRILAALEAGPKTAVGLTQATKLSLGSVEKHLEVLLIANLVHRNQDLFATNLPNG